MGKYVVTVRDRVDYANAHASPGRAARTVIFAIVTGVVTWGLFVLQGNPIAFDHEWTFIFGTIIVAGVGGGGEWAWRLLTAENEVLRVLAERASPIAVLVPKFTGGWQSHYRDHQELGDGRVRYRVGLLNDSHIVAKGVVLKVLEADSRGRPDDPVPRVGWGSPPWTVSRFDTDSETVNPGDEALYEFLIADTRNRDHPLFLAPWAKEMPMSPASSSHVLRVRFKATAANAEPVGFAVRIHLDKDSGAGYRLHMITEQ